MVEERCPTPRNFVWTKVNHFPAGWTLRSTEPAVTVGSLAWYAGFHNHVDITSVAHGISTGITKVRFRF